MTRLRRIAAIVLPDLLVELVQQPTPIVADGAPVAHAKPRPVAVLLVDEESTEPTKTTAVIDAVSPAALRLGVRPGQTVAEASAFVAGLSIREVTRARVNRALGEVAELALGFGTLASIEAPDTVWLDVTGVAHLFGTEEELASELAARVRELGHLVRVAIAEGPLLSRALARWMTPRRGRDSTWVVSALDAPRVVAELPVGALPLDAERVAWLVRLGVRTVGELAKLPRAATASRLGERASIVLDLAQGCDGTPLVAYEPPALPTEDKSWDDGVDGVEPLLFVLRGLVARLSARLEGRREAVVALEVDIEHDRSIARLRHAEPVTTLRFELASPMWRAAELERVIASRLQRLDVAAPSMGLRIRATAISRALELQLDLARGASGLGSNLGKGPETLPVVLGELAADIGKKRFGVLQLPSAHRPEDASRLVAVPPETLMGALPKKRRAVATTGEPPAPSGTPVRLLPRPVPFEAPLRQGVTVTLDHRLYTIRRVEFARRLERVAWWSEHPTSRDYVHVWLQGAESDVEALVYVNRDTGSRFLQGVMD